MYWPNRPQSSIERKSLSGILAAFRGFIWPSLYNSHSHWWSHKRKKQRGHCKHSSWILLLSGKPKCHKCLQTVSSRQKRWSDKDKELTHMFKSVIVPLGSLEYLCVLMIQNCMNEWCWWAIPSEEVCEFMRSASISAANHTFKYSLPERTFCFLPAFVLVRGSILTNKDDCF